MTVMVSDYTKLSNSRKELCVKYKLYQKEISTLYFVCFNLSTNFKVKTQDKYFLCLFSWLKPDCSLFRKCPLI